MNNVERDLHREVNRSCGVKLNVTYMNLTVASKTRARVHKRVVGRRRGKRKGTATHTMDVRWPMWSPADIFSQLVKKQPAAPPDL
jgi:hypothetical protein